ncbi:hypothetical protein AAFN90_16230 [Erwiniaceae bacterium CAU 1747]
MPYSCLRLMPPCFPTTRSLRLLTAVTVLLLAACSSGYKGMECDGQRQSLEGQPLGSVQGLVIDRFNSFSVTLPGLTLDSGTLQSTNRERYIPSAVTRDGWLAQRISDQQFSIINSPQNQMITFSCPAPGQL